MGLSQGKLKVINQERVSMRSVQVACVIFSYVYKYRKYSDLKTISLELGKLLKKITCFSVVYCRNVR
jgi:hypothetical protein